MVSCHRNLASKTLSIEFYLVRLCVCVCVGVCVCVCGCVFSYITTNPEAGNSELVWWQHNVLWDPMMVGFMCELG